VEIREVEEPDPAPDETLVEVRAFSINRGEPSLLSNRPEGWQPRQDVAGVVARATADGSGPSQGTRVGKRYSSPSRVAMADPEFLAAET
jgi:NADPH2:quinone reductase